MSKSEVRDRKAVGCLFWIVLVFIIVAAGRIPLDDGKYFMLLVSIFILTLWFTLRAYRCPRCGSFFSIRSHTDFKKEKLGLGEEGYHGGWFKRYRYSCKKCSYQEMGDWKLD